ncbi:MAG: UDP-galactopyranose mutase [Nanoarchaeota archaeon]
MKIKRKERIFICGAGISGLTLAERISSKLEKEVLVIEKRNHIGGNCYDFYNKDGLLVPLYGPHLFHTDSLEVWNYLSKFTDWIPYKHKVRSNVDGKKIVPIPVNITTVNELFNKKITNEREMDEWLKKETKCIQNPLNSEEVALSLIGKRLYELLIKNYTKKQWDIWPSELEPEVLRRLPVKKSFDDYYFSDKYQAMPKEGYTKMFERMISNPKIKVLLNTDFFDVDTKNHDLIIFTGRVDSFFRNKGIEPLQYRSLKFKFETLNKQFFQEVAVVNYPNTERFSRITEPKRSTNQKGYKKTTIIKEYFCWGKEPYYPIFTKENKEKYEKYAKLAKDTEKDGIYFIGRLAQYKYFDMDDAFKNALDFFNERILLKYERKI